MTDKAFAFKRPPQPIAPSDSWVESRVTPVAPSAAKLSKITAKIPEPLKRRIKARCAERGEFVEDMLLRLLDAEFPA